MRGYAADLLSVDPVFIYRVRKDATNVIALVDRGIGGITFHRLPLPPVDAVASAAPKATGAAPPAPLAPVAPIKISATAQRLAKKAGLDLATVKATGRNGSITVADVRRTIKDMK